MHVPDPFGRFPMILRSSDAANPRNGELMMDYTKEYLYYIDRETGEKIGVADSIYKKIIASRLQNSRIFVTREDDQGTEPETPAVEDREMNEFYFSISNRSYFEHNE